MALTHGMNVAAVRSSMQRIDSFASQLDSIRASIDKEMSNILTLWSGPDATKFVNADWKMYKDNLGTLAVALRSLAETGRRQAFDQENVSRA